MSLQALAGAIAGPELTNAAVVDCTANLSVVDAYPASYRRQPAHHHAEQAR